MSCDSNEELKLTKDYKYLLSYIRPLIDQLDKSRDAQLCLLWLSKLEQCSSWERNYRNKILTELCKQVKSNCLKPPFNTAPPNGPLRNILWGEWKTRDWVNRQCSEALTSTEEVFSSSSHHSFGSHRNKHLRQSCPPIWRSFGNNWRNKGSKTIRDSVDHAECFAIQKAYHERAQSDQMVIERYQDIIKSLVSQQLKAENSPIKWKKLQSCYENKMTELKISLQEAQKQNEMLKTNLEYLKKNSTALEEKQRENESLQKMISDLKKEKNSLAAKYKESEEDKLTKLANLISKLSESEKKLKDNEQRLKSLEMKCEDNQDIESQCEARMYEKEQVHLSKINDLEKLLLEKQVEIDGLKEQMNNQSFHYGQEISRLKQQLEDNLNFEKDKEKIKSLKIKTKKLEKVKEHMTVLFQSQMQQILAKKDFYIASLEMQLKMNNKECGGGGGGGVGAGGAGGAGGGGNFDFHNSFDQKISELEAQYRKLLEDSEQQSIKRRQHDLQKIHTLEKQLLSFGGVAVDNDSDADNHFKIEHLPTDSALNEKSNAGSS